MKKSFLVSLILWAVIVILPSSVSAHILETDGNIGAVLHIDPDDDPIAGSQAGFFFEFKDQQNKFDPKLCDCTFLVSEQGKQIFSQDLFTNNSAPSLDNASVFFTFPKRDVYQVQVVGRPLSPNGFQSFTLTYNIRVDRGGNAAALSHTTASTPSSTNWLMEHGPYLLLGILLAGIIVGVLLIIRKKSLKTQPKTSVSRTNSALPAASVNPTTPQNNLSNPPATKNPKLSAKEVKLK